MKIKFFSVCSQTFIKLVDDQADFRTWYTAGENVYFHYMVGDDPKLFRLPTSDTVSLLNEDEAAPPFCG